MQQRDLAEVTLIAVSKTFSPDAIEPVVAAGQWVFGEDRVQEAEGEMSRLTGLRSAPGIGDSASRWTIAIDTGRKKRSRCSRAIHSVDRPSLCGSALATGDQRTKEGVSRLYSRSEIQYRRRAAESRHPAARCRCIPCGVSR